MLRGESRGQSGYSLAEVIIAIVLLSSVFLAFAAAIFTVSRATSTNKSVQAIDTALVSYGGILRASDRPLADGSPPAGQIAYVPCPEAGPDGSEAVAEAYETAALAVIETNLEAGATDAWRRPDNMDIEIVGVDSWNPDTKEFATDCLVPDNGGQRITYRVSIGTTTRSAQTVKRYPGPSA